jgi:hypothetical protein
MTQTLVPVPRLDTAPSLADRCDRCGVPAKLHVDLTAGGSLAFCGHHANRLAPDITRLATAIVVEEGFEWRGSATGG